MKPKKIAIDDAELGLVSLERQLSIIATAISRTRQEISDARHEQEVGRTRDELAEVLRSTEQATNAILSASEAIGAITTRMIRHANASASNQDARDIDKQIQIIFENCNFQDLTGQRITKVVRTIQFIERRIDEMLKIWSGNISTQVSENTNRDGIVGELELLNGPVLPGEATVSQLAVDAMFP